MAIGGVNTTPAHARALAGLLDGLKVKLNIIDVSDATGRYRAPTPDELAAFRDALGALGAPVVRRYSGGNEIGAGCGTLAASRSGGVVAGSGTRTPQGALSLTLPGGGEEGNGSSESPSDPLAPVCRERIGRGVRRRCALQRRRGFARSQTMSRPATCLPVSAVQMRSASSGGTFR